MKASELSKFLNSKPDFVIMNRDSEFFCGLYGNDILWTNKIEEAKTFKEKSKISLLKRWKPEQKMEIMYL